MHFEGGLRVEMERAEYEDLKHNKDWVVQFRPETLTVLE